MTISFLINSKPNIKEKEIHGIVVPHAGLAYSGEIAGKAFSLIKNKKPKKALILGPSHYISLKGLATLENLETPLGKIKLTGSQFPKLKYEHSIDNQIPFLQIINPKIEIMPLIVGQITKKEAKEIAQLISINYSDYFYIFSSDLSHFLRYNEAKIKDRQTIEAITSLNSDEKKLDACGIYQLMVLIELCKLKNWNPNLIEYKNSGDITNEKSSVVGYSSFYF